MWMTPPEYLVLDIETAAGEPTEAEAWMRTVWSPNPNWKPATIGERFLQALEQKKEQLALLDSSPIITVALKTPADLRVLHWLPVDAQEMAGVLLERTPDQKALLERTAQYLAACSQETVLVGHNLLHFDLPKLRQGMLRHGVRLPTALVDRDHPVYDTMREWSRFTLDDRQYVSLAELAETMGLVEHKAIISGAMVPEMYAEGRWAELLAYAAADVLAQWQVFLRMTGQLESEAPLPEAAGHSLPVAPSVPAAERENMDNVEDVERLMQEFISCCERSLS